MRRGLLALLALLGAASFASAQVQFLTQRGLPPPPTTVSPDDVVTRLMTFDQNNDGRIAVGELSERMRPLVARGDKNGDSALDRTEIRTMAAAPAPAQVSAQRQRILGSGGYGFGDDIGLSSKNHIEGALEDLRLASDTKERALPIVRAYADTVEQAASAELISRMEPLLSLDQLATFTTALSRQQGRQITLKSPTGEIRTLFVVRGGGGGDLTSRVEAMQLGAAKTEQAKQAIEDFKARTRLGTEPERSGLLAQLKDMLTGEELDNYSAALARRPVVATGLQLAARANFTVRGADIIDVVKPAVLIDKPFAVGATFR